MDSKTFEADPGRPNRFHFDAGLTGDVVINVAPADVTTVPGQPDVLQVTVPGANLRALVLDVLRDDLVERLEAMTPRQLAAFFTLQPR